MIFKKLLALLLALLMVLGMTACAIDEETVELAADVALTLLEEAEPSDLAEEIPEILPEDITPEPSPTPTLEELISQMINNKTGGFPE